MGGPSHSHGWLPYLMQIIVPRPMRLYITALMLRIVIKKTASGRAPNHLYGPASASYKPMPKSTSCGQLPFS